MNKWGGTVSPFFLVAGAMLKLLIFNPEHDLCLANGDANYMPPASALRFASQGAALMRMLYGEDGIGLADYCGQPVEVASTRLCCLPMHGSTSCGSCSTAARCCRCSLMP